MANVSVTIEGDINEVIATLKGMAAGAALAPGAAGDAPTAALAATPASEEAPAAELAEAGGADAGDGAAMAYEEEYYTPPPAPSPPEPEAPLASWNMGYVDAFWVGLSDTARQAILRVSRSPNHTQQRAQLMHTLQLSQRGLSGSLSSQGHSLNRVQKRGNVRLPRPLNYDKVEDVYILDPDFASAMRDLGMS